MQSRLLLDEMCQQSSDTIRMKYNRRQRVMVRLSRGLSFGLRRADGLLRGSIRPSATKCSQPSAAGQVQRQFWQMTARRLATNPLDQLHLLQEGAAPLIMTFE